MQKPNKELYLIDFDSTFIKSEGLDELAEIVLKDHQKKDTILATIKETTKQGMEGKIPFGQSLTTRLKLLHANKSHVIKAAKLLKTHITNSIKRNKSFFKKNNEHIYIISGGFKELILPVVKPFGIDESHIFANTFVYDKKKNIIGVDTNNPLAMDDGKIKLVKSLKFDRNIVVIGDGYTDYKLKEAGVVTKFIAFTENIEREIVTKNADQIAKSFDEFLYRNNLNLSFSYPKNRIKALVLENIDKEAVETFEEEGYQVTHLSSSLSEEELLEIIPDISILCIRSRTHITKKILSVSTRLLAIGIFAIGTNQVDLKNAAERGIAVFNAPYSNSRSVVELILGEIIVLTRGVFDKNLKLHNGVWDKSASGSHEIKGKTLGIIGYGNIGTQVGVVAEALGMNVLFYDIAERPTLGNAKGLEKLEEVLKRSDIITVHIDGRQENTNFIDEKKFKIMKNDVIFLNASRGFVVDMTALAKYLKNGKIKGAAIDVFPKEPKNNNEPFALELQQLPNVILTPHIGGSTEEAQKNIARFVSNKLIEYLNSGNTSLSVNLPNIQLPTLTHAHRLLHIHENVPGILAKINSVLGENSINIVEQYLKTSDDIGYVITDVNKKYNKKLLNILKKVPHTIRFRVLY